MLLAAWTAAQPELLAQGESESVPVTDAMLQAPASGDWPMWRRTLDGWGYEHPDVVFDDPGSRPVRRTTRADSALNTLSGRITTTPDNQILVELAPDDIVPASLFDLNGQTLVFTPDGRGGYSRSVRDVALEEDIGEEPSSDRQEIELDFPFEFSGRQWRSFFVTGNGLITFGKPFPSWDSRTPSRFGTMQMIADAFLVAPTISALYKPYLGARTYVSSKPDRVVVTWDARDVPFAVYGRRPKEVLRYQIALHSNGSVALHYGPQPADADEAIRDGIVGLFPEVAASAPTDLSEPSSRPSPTQYEVFRYVAIRDRDQGVADVSCRIIKVLGDHFDFFAFNSEFRVDLQEAYQPGHGFAGFYPGNIQAEVEGIGIEGDYTTPCESRLKNSWGYPVWMKAASMMRASYAEDGHRTPYDDGLTVFAHEIGHTWLAYASYLAGGERKSMQTAERGVHWALEVHAPAPFPWREQYNGSVMGGAYWRENSDGTFTATSGWTTRGGGFSWLDLYLMGLAPPDEVPDMFILRNIRREGPCTAEPWECERFGPFAADKEIVTMEQVLAAMGPRNPPAERARKAYNMGFVYFLLPGQTPDPELLREHAEYRDRAVDHWRHITGGRSQITTAVPTLPNGSPVAVGTLPDLTLRAGGRAAVVDVAGAFRDPEGDPLTYRVASSAPAVAMAVVAGSQAAVTPVSAGRATVTVTATDTGGLSAMQQFAVAVVVSSTFTDHPLRLGTTPIKAVHFHELRERIVALRVRSGLPVVGWTDPTLVAGVTPVKRVHLTELRSALDAAYDAVRRPRPAYTDAVVAAGVTAVKAAHIMELRSAVLLLESGTGTAP